MTVVKMMKATVICHGDDVEKVTQTLQEAGVLHVVPLEEHERAHSRGDEEVTAYRRLDHLAKALAGVAPAPAKLEDDALALRDVIGRVETLIEERQSLERELHAVERDIRELKPWGELDPGLVESLRAEGVPVVFAIITREQWQLLDKKARAFTVANESDEVLWVVFFGEDDLPITPIAVPEHRLSKRQARREEIVGRIAEINRAMGRYSHFVPLIRNRMKVYQDRVQLLEAMDGTHRDGPLVALRGFVPNRRNLELQRALRAHQVTLVLEEPGPDDDVPVLLYNNWFFSGFEAVLKTFSGLSYREKDVTWMVGILFILFGGLCLLDAGYGVMLLITGLVLGWRGQKAFARVFLLTGAFAIPVGLASGQAFGLILGKDFSRGESPLLPLATDPLSAFNFSLAVGGVAMAFSYAIALWQRGPRTHALGNLLLVLALGILAVAHLGTPILVADVEAAATLSARLTMAGSVLVVLALIAWLAFPEPVFGRTARVPNIAWTLYSGVTGLIQDILSHMRLFGIALSGSILAMVVNQIGGQFPLILTVCFAIVGHIFVYALALLSLYIHSNRLIFLEIGSKCIDGGHLYYQPLQRGTSS